MPFTWLAGLSNVSHVPCAIVFHAKQYSHRSMVVDSITVLLRPLSSHSPFRPLLFALGCHPTVVQCVSLELGPNRSVFGQITLFYMDISRGSQFKQNHFKVKCSIQDNFFFDIFIEESF